MTEATLAIALPLVAETENAADVLEMMNRRRERSVIVTDGSRYRAHLIEQVRAVVQQDQSAKVGATEGGTRITLLTTHRAAQLGLDFSALGVESVGKAFEQLGEPATIASIARSAGGGRIANTLLNPAILRDNEQGFRFLGDSYVCPVDLQVYSSGGNCPVHPDTPLTRVRNPDDDAI